jgi:hypothetical protein
MYMPRRNNVSIRYRYLSQESSNDDTQYPAFRFLVIRDNAIFGGSAALTGLGDSGLGFMGGTACSTFGSCLVPRRMENGSFLGGDERTLKGRFGVTNVTHINGKLQPIYTEHIPSSSSVSSSVASSVSSSSLKSTTGANLGFFFGLPPCSLSVPSSSELVIAE